MGRRAVIFHAGQIYMFSDRQEYQPEAERTKDHVTTERPKNGDSVGQRNPNAYVTLCDYPALYFQDSPPTFKNSTAFHLSGLEGICVL